MTQALNPDKELSGRIEGNSTKMLNIHVYL
jgi:hypothetical protein